MTPKAQVIKRMFAKLEFIKSKNLCFRKTLKKIKRQSQTVRNCLYTVLLMKKQTVYIQNKYRTPKTQ